MIRMSAMASPQTLARRLVRTMVPWFLLIAFGLTAAQVTVQYLSVNGAIVGDLESLARTVEPSVAQAVWELDQPSLDDLARGAMLNAIVTGVSITGDNHAPLVAIGRLPEGPPERRSPWFRLAKRAQVPLYVRSQRGERYLIGQLDIYSSPEVVWRRIRSGLYVSLASSILVTGALWLLFFGTIRSQLSKTVTGVARTVASWTDPARDGAVRKIEYPYRDELGDLVDALHENRERLARSLQDLGSINQNLEKIVEARTSELRAAKDAAESADRLKSAFLATMSHELRTPLNSIIGFTGILLQELVGPLNPEQKKQMGMVRNSSSHLLELINDVLDLSKIEAGQLQVAHEPVDVKAAALKVTESLRPLARKKGLALHCEVADTLEPLTSDRRRVEQILTNLIGNAIKFTETGEVRMRVAAAGQAIRIDVTDTGIGIEGADLDQLFQPFYQIDTGLTRKYGGTGLGLSICKRLTELLGGRIWAESAPGQGSTFTFLLPRAEALP